MPLSSAVRKALSEERKKLDMRIKADTEAREKIDYVLNGHASKPRKTWRKSSSRLAPLPIRVGNMQDKYKQFLRAAVVNPGTSAQQAADWVIDHRLPSMKHISKELLRQRASTCMWNLSNQGYLEVDRTLHPVAYKATKQGLEAVRLLNEK